MNRWIRLLATMAAATSIAFGALPVFAQTMTRQVPADVKTAVLAVTAPPEITLDGKPDRLSPGARIRGTNNMLVMSASAVGQSLPVVYRRDGAGLVHEVWVMSDEEFAQLRKAEGGGSGFQGFLDLVANILGLRAASK